MTDTIRIKDLATVMGKDPKELLFELRSIGVNLASVDDALPQEVVQALMSGEDFKAPAQVIVREDSAGIRKSRKTAKKKLPKTKLVTTRDTPVREIPKKAVTKKEEEVQQEVKKPAETPVPSKRKPDKKTTEAKPVKKPAAKPRTREVPATPAQKASTKPTPKASRGATAEEIPVIDKKKKQKVDQPDKMVRKPARKRSEKKKVKQGQTEEMVESVDVRKFVGSSIRTASSIQEAEEQRKALKKRKKKHEEEEEVHIPLTLDEQVARLKTLIPEKMELVLTEGATLRDVIDNLGVKVKDFMPYLFKKGIIVSVNQPVTEEFLETLSEELGFTFKRQTFEEKLASDTRKKSKKQGQLRPPVVTVMGHVDHGKTSILDYIRKTRVASGEAGGITQHIGAYRVEINGSKIVFIDTPGHEAFTQMRSRGTSVTDVVILVVAADDGIMPQTLEAINHAKAAEVPIIVAINKIDKANADIDRVKKQLSDRGLLVEDWGGDTVAVSVSAVTGEGIDSLLEMILLVSELQELKADSTVPAKGVVLEARKETGRGIVATVLVQEGELVQKNVFICGNTHGRVRAMFDDTGKPVTRAEPSTPVEVVGMIDLPTPGDILQVVANEKESRRIVELRQQQRREDKIRRTAVSLEDIFASIQGDEKKSFKFIVKTDVTGTLEVVKSTIEKAATDEVDIHVVHEGAGAVTVNDVALATASDAIIIGFNVKPEKKAQKEAEIQGVDIRLYSVIYDLIEDIQAAVEGATIPEMKEIVLGSARVLKVFRIPKVGVIAGSLVQEGLIKRGASVRIIRDNTVINSGKIVSLKRFEEDVTDVKKGFECGIGVDRSKDIQIDDILECFERQEAES